MILENIREVQKALGLAQIAISPLLLWAAGAAKVEGSGHWGGVESNKA